MNNFLRAVRLVLRSRATLVGVCGTSLLVGILWGANIGAVYPFVEVVFQRRSLPQWIDGEISKANSSTAALRGEVRQIERWLAAPTHGNRAQVERELSSLRKRLRAEERALAWSKWLQPYVHAYLPSGPFETMVWIVASLLIGTALKCGFLVTNMILVERLVQLATFDLRKQFYRQSLSWDLAIFGQQHDSELLSRFTNDVGGLQTGLSTLFGKALVEPLKMIACLIGASFISWQLLVFSLLVAPPALFLMRRLAKSIKRASRRALEETAQLFERITETYQSIQTVKAFTMEPYERLRFHQSAKTLYRKGMKIVVYSSLTKPITELLGIGIIAVSLVAGAYLVLNQTTDLFGIQMCARPLSLGQLLLFYSLLAGVSDPARKLTEIFASVQGALAAADRVYAMLDRQPRIANPVLAKSVRRPHGRLAFHGVAFHYHAPQPVLQDIDLEIRFGETIALVGPNGCGKTTLINLIPRFYDPIEGVVRLDDVDLREMRLRDLRTRIGLVTQQTQLFHDTILNNIRYGSPRASDAAVIEAAQKAHAHRFIEERLSDGYQTIAGQGGNRLSGGQRQRIALARAILRDPEILILDEATSQIDLESEHLIQEALQRFVEGRTALIITHRLSTLALADRIVVMEAGRIADCGTHDELLGRCVLYRRLYDVQFKQSA